MLGFAEDEVRNGDVSEGIWLHFLAVSYSSQYLLENADGIAEDPPRCPFPSTRERLEASANLGKRLFQLLDLEREQLSEGDRMPVALMVSKRPGGQISADAGDLAISVGWGRKEAEPISGGTPRSGVAL